MFGLLVRFLFGLCFFPLVCVFWCVELQKSPRESIHGNLERTYFSKAHISPSVQLGWTVLGTLLLRFPVPCTTNVIFSSLAVQWKQRGVLCFRVQDYKIHYLPSTRRFQGKGQVPGITEQFSPTLRTRFSRTAPGTRMC